MPLIEDEYGRRRYVSSIEAYGVDIHAADVPAKCPNCLGTRAPSATDPEWKGRCECVEPAARLDYLSSCSLERLLLELLATLHGDDGNHTDKVGMARSVYDAEVRVRAAVDYETRIEAAKACGAVVTQHEIGFTHAEFAKFLNLTAPAAGGKDAWKPIETAPKTRRAILVWCPAIQCTFAVSWYDDAWIFFGASGELRDFPTHWMPLPKAPGDQP